MRFLILAFGFKERLVKTKTHNICVMRNKRFKTRKQENKKTPDLQTSFFIDIFGQETAFCDNLGLPC